MNRLIVTALSFGLGCVALTGCTNQELRKDTIDIASTVVDIQQQEVLDNIARFDQNPSALPSMVQIQSGVIQVADTINPTGKVTYAKMAPTLEGDFSVTRQWTANWTVNPVTDPNDVKRLQILFKNVTGYYMDKDKDGQIEKDWKKLNPGKIETQRKDIGPEDAPDTAKQEITYQVSPSLGVAPTRVTKLWYTTERPTGNDDYLTGHFGKKSIYVVISSDNLDHLGELILYTMKATPTTKQNSLLSLPLREPLLNP